MSAENSEKLHNYIMGHYSKVRPHQHNGDLTPHEFERRYWNTYKSVTKIS